MTKDISKYYHSLLEIRERLEVIEERISVLTAVKNLKVEIEFLCLQFRKVLELIALLSLVANKNEYSKYYKKFASQWNAKLILADLEKINPDFYPVPKKQIKTIENGSKIYELAPLDLLEERLSLGKNGFLNIYEQCGGALHAKNPYANKKNILELEKYLVIWLWQIKTLLNNHVIKLCDKKTIVIGILESVDGQTQVCIGKRNSSKDGIYHIDVSQLR